MARTMTASTDLSIGLGVSNSLQAGSSRAKTLPNQYTPPDTANSDTPLFYQRSLPPSPVQTFKESSPQVDIDSKSGKQEPSLGPSSGASLKPATTFSTDSSGFPVSSLLTDDPENDRRNNPVEAPWKFAGYRILSRWLASDNAFLVVRRLGTLNARVALSMQDGIVQLE